MCGDGDEPSFFFFFYSVERDDSVPINSTSKTGAPVEAAAATTFGRYERTNSNKSSALRRGEATLTPDLDRRLLLLSLARVCDDEVGENAWQLSDLQASVEINTAGGCQNFDVR
eukprot:TRINITY_DN17163_c0_g1_i1.p1 TRINITY_DN17163_c0_g1~~TRINITY_DN17163_c0_g1_i1.p1  ORF type:complete len:114 (-),score=19.72 TRINITY_DN17163_c0_g1_i1:35-376(-)